MENGMENKEDIVPELSCNSRIRDMRQPYMARGQSFTEDQLVAHEPFAQFADWFNLACQIPEIQEANAMCIATCNREGYPSCRMVLLKGYDASGFKFFTNYNSRKGRDLEENPRAALNFFWEPLRKCVRIEGHVEKLSAEESSEYFHSRPVGSQIGSAISNQSQPIPSRDVLLKKENEMLECYSDENPVPRPESWGGYRVIPESIEFWQGHVNRIHDRIRFRKLRSGEIVDDILLHQGENDWVYERLAP